MESGESHRLRLEVERALKRAFDPADVLPRLARLARVAAPSSDDGVFANRQLAELLVEQHPWRAAIHAKTALAYRPGDDRAWAVLAFCHTLLGNFRSAAAAYKQATACSPSNPWYAHNLGHLLDVALGAPDRALPWLSLAYGAKTDNSEITASYAHALARTGRTTEAREVLGRGLERFDSRELRALLRWIDQGAPSQKKKPKAAAPTKDRRLTTVLKRGLENLPLDKKQRERALAVASDAAASVVPYEAADIACLAAAVAYAIVYVDHLPLSQAEVAAPFRVGVASLRGRFAELRAKLDLIPGDTRYATVY